MDIFILCEDITINLHIWEIRLSQFRAKQNTYFCLRNVSCTFLFSFFIFSFFYTHPQRNLRFLMLLLYSFQLWDILLWTHLFLLNFAFKSAFLDFASSCLLSLVIYFPFWLIMTVFSFFLSFPVLREFVLHVLYGGMNTLHLEFQEIWNRNPSHARFVWLTDTFENVR